MSNTQTLTIRFDIHDGDVTTQFLWPLPKTGIAEVVQATLENGQWTITSAEQDASSKWIGHGQYKQEAILNYLKARLGLYEDNEQ
jgi:hypothetical protein